MANCLDKIFKPERIALIGATEREASVGKAIMQNLLQSSSKVFPVNPKRKTVFGIQCHQSLNEIQEAIDLAIIVTPATTVPSIIEACVEKKVGGAVIISAGFKEAGSSGAELEAKIKKIASGKMRIIGPNCLGIMNPKIGFNGTFAADIAEKGNIAFISQSGALGTAVLDWSLKEKVGFSSFVSVGSMLDVNFADLIEYFGTDPATKSILIYMENIVDPVRFLEAAKKVAFSKPIVLIKAGRTEESIKAAVSHTGALAGSDEVLSAALRRAGVLRVETIDELFAMTEALSKQPMPKGPNLTIVTNAGGPGVIATDALISNGGKLTPLNNEQVEVYSTFLPPSWSHNNPIDILGDASPDTYFKTVEVAATDPNADGVLVILTPQEMTDPTKTALKLKEFSTMDKPILASFMGAKRVEEGARVLKEAGIPFFQFPDMACKTFATMWAHRDQLKELKENPTIPKARSLQKRGVLDEVESKKFLEEYGIPSVQTRLAKSKDEAVEIASAIGFPIVLKIYSKTITHKTDVGGVKLGLKTDKDVEKAFKEIEKNVPEEDFQGVSVQPMVDLNGYEIILGSLTDPMFGPVILFGAGGTFVEVFKDQSLALPTLNRTLAFRLMRRTKIYHALKGVRGKKGVDLEALADLLVNFSRMVLENSWIQECDINPLLATEKGFIALDARIIGKK